jgi:hypothetical protein
VGASVFLFVGAGVAAVCLALGRPNANQSAVWLALGRPNANWFAVCLALGRPSLVRIRLILLFEAVPHYQFLFIFIQSFVLPCLSIKHFSSIKALEDDCSRFNARKIKA